MAVERESGLIVAQQRMVLVAKIVASVALIGGALFYLLGSSFEGNLVYDRTVDEVLAQRQTLEGESLRVGGKLVPLSHQVTAETTEHHFALQGTKATLPVRFKGLWPDAAMDGRELMVEGSLDEQGVVVAQRVLARCPSRYKRRVADDTE
jgi:cytochrome c-type biogenesis protein CcmE